MEFLFRFKVIAGVTQGESKMRKTKYLLLGILWWPLMATAAQPDFALPDLNGKVRHLSEFRGKWVVVNYWATWCPPCLDEIPELEEFHEAHKVRDAVVIGINYEDSDPADLRSFVQDYMISYPILRADLGRPNIFGQLYGLPTSYIISPEGELVGSKTGAVSRSYLENAIKQNGGNKVVLKQ